MATDHPRTPPPGSDEAREQGCLCPRYDNRRGEGYALSAKCEPMFVIRDDCPLHGHITTPDPAHNPANPRSDATPGEPHTRAHNGEGA